MTKVCSTVILLLLTVKNHVQAEAVLPECEGGIIHKFGPCDVWYNTVTSIMLLDKLEL